MSTPSTRRRYGRRHSRRLSRNGPLGRRTSSTPPTPDVVRIDDDHDQTCIDLTSDDGVGMGGGGGDIIDLTSANDSPVVVLNAIDADPNYRRSRPHRGGRRRRNSHRSVPVRSQRLFQYQSSDDSGEDVLPSFDTKGTPYRSPPAVEGSSGDVTSPVEVRITCPICMDDYKQIRRSGRRITSTTCGHMFCSDCIRQAVDVQHCCPTCRKRLTHRQTHPLFF